MAEQKEVHIVSEEGIKVEYPIGATISIKGKICKVVEDIDLSDEEFTIRTQVRLYLDYAS